jgi:DNA polymerase
LKITERTGQAPIPNEQSTQTASTKVVIDDSPTRPNVTEGGRKSDAQAAIQPTTAASDTASPSSSPAGVRKSNATIVVGDGQWSSPELAPDDRTKNLATLGAQAAECKLCQQLATQRTNVVFGEGSVSARIVFFGEAPDAVDDQSGRPFTGKAGALLDKIITAMKLKREETYLLNTINCRPPSNRPPNQLELERCAPFFVQQLEIVRPEMIVCLGQKAAKALLGSAAAIGKLRGQFHHYKGSKVAVTWHLEYLLRKPEAKHQTWEDMQQVMKELELLEK